MNPALLRFWWALPLAVALIWGLRVDHLRATYKARWQAVSTEYAAFKVAIIDKTAQALAAQKAVNQAKEAEYQEKAREADASLDDLRARLRSALVRKAADRGAGRAAGSASQGDGAGVPEEVPAPAPGTGGPVQIDSETLVGLSAYAIAAHEWAVSLESDQ